MPMLRSADTVLCRYTNQPTSVTFYNHVRRRVKSISDRHLRTNQRVWLVFFSFLLTPVLTRDDVRCDVIACDEICFYDDDQIFVGFCLFSTRSLTPLRRRVGSAVIYRPAVATYTSSFADANSVSSLAFAWTLSSPRRLSFGATSR